MGILNEEWVERRERRDGGVDSRVHGWTARECRVGQAALTTRARRPKEARADFREIIGRKGHSVDNARDAMARLETAFAAGDLERTPLVDQAVA